MKKICIFLVGCLWVSILSSCVPAKKASDEFFFESDSQVYMYADLWGYSFAEGPQGYYYIFENKLHIIDKTTFLDTVLCAKPNCTHEDETCNAMVGTPIENLHYSDGALYTLGEVSNFGEPAHWFLQRISLDGSSRKRIADITWDTSKCEGLPVFFVVHRGKFYYIVQQDAGIDGCDLLMELDMETGKTKEIAEMPGMQYLKAVGENLYWRSHGENVSIYQYNVTSKEITAWENGRLLYLCKDKLLLATYDTENKRYDLSWKDYAGEDIGDTFFRLQLGQNAFQADGKYFYRYAYAGEDRTLDVYDVATLEPVTVLEVPESITSYYRCMVCPGEILILYDTGKAIVYYASTSSIGTPDFQWHEVEKVN